MNVPPEAPGDARFTCAKLRCTLTVGACGARWKKTLGRGGPIHGQHPAAESCTGCPVGEANAPHAIRVGAPRGEFESKRETAIRSIDACRVAEAEERHRRSELPSPVPGRRYGEAIVVREVERGYRGRRQVVVKCTGCGGERVLQWGHVLRGRRSGRCSSCAAAVNAATRNLIEHRGERLHKAEWARRYGLTPQTLARRLSLGWTLERALETPLRNAGGGEAA